MFWFNLRAACASILLLACAVWVLSDARMNVLRQRAAIEWQQKVVNTCQPITRK